MEKTSKTNSKSITKRMFFAITFVLAIFSNAIADENKSEWDFAFSAGWLSKYVFPVGSEAHKSPVVQSSLTASHSSGWYFNIWHSGEEGSEFIDNENGFGSEIDLTIGKAGSIGNIEVDAGISYWACGNISDSKENDIVAPYIELTRPCKLSSGQTLSPYVRLQGYFQTNGVNNDGFCTYFGANYTKTDFLPKCDLSLGLGAIYDDGIFCGDNGLIGKLHAGLNWKVSKSTTITLPKIIIFTPLQSLEDDRETEFVFGAAFSVSF